jgi:hypothetical protein
MSNEIKLTKEQAIKILVEVTALLKLTRQEHELVLKALEVLRQD